MEVGTATYSMDDSDDCILRASDGGTRASTLLISIRRGVEAAHEMCQRKKRDAVLERFLTASAATAMRRALRGSQAPLTSQSLVTSLR